MIRQFHNPHLAALALLAANLHAQMDGTTVVIAEPAAAPQEQPPAPPPAAEPVAPVALEVGQLMARVETLTTQVQEATAAAEQARDQSQSALRLVDELRNLQTTPAPEPEEEEPAAIVHAVVEPEPQTPAAPEKKRGMLARWFLG